MAAALLCTLSAVTLSVVPPRSQFHTLEYFVATCPSESWTVFRSTHFKSTPEPCGGSWGLPQGTGCSVGPIMGSYTGLYWCQKRNHSRTECSPPANITVGVEKVILQSPLFPVKEGERVTLRCSFKNRNHEEPTSNFNASFFRNGFFFDRSPGGEVVLSSVSQKDEGLYRCEHPTGGKSLESRLVVKLKDTVLPVVPPSSAPHPMGIPLYSLVSFLVLVLLYTFILCISISIYCKWTRARAERRQRKSERVSLRRIREA